MMNDSGPYGPNNAPNRAAASHISDSNSVNNLNNYGKTVQQAAGTASENTQASQAHNAPNYGQPPLNVHPIMQHSQTYQTMAHPSSFMPQNNPFSHENAVRNNFPVEMTAAQAEHHRNMINYHQNRLISESQTTSENESSVIGNNVTNPLINSQTIRKRRSSKSSEWRSRNHETKTESRNRTLIAYNLLVNTEIYHHISTNSFYKNPSLLRSMSQNTSSSSESSSRESSPRSMSHNSSVSADNRSRMPMSNFTFNEADNFNKKCGESFAKNDEGCPKNLSQNHLNNTRLMTLNTSVASENKSESNLFTNNAEDIPNNLNLKRQISAVNMSQTPTVLQKSISIGKTLNDSINSQNSSPSDNGISERKRQSLEKTVRLIESIITRSANKNANANIATDPLALSPNPTTNDSPTEDLNSVCSETDSDDEALIKMVPLEKGKSPSKKIQSTRRSHVIETETEVQFDMRVKGRDNLNVKSEMFEQDFYHPCDTDYANPFIRDSNAMPRTNVDETKIIQKDNSEDDALNCIKTGTCASSYYECPHCSLLLLHPKRFLIHTKWHTFGLLNEKRAELAREREEKIRGKREARSMQRLSVTEALGADDDQTYPCKDCDKVFQSRNSLRNHRRRLHIIEETECRICLLPFYGLKALREHMNIHTDAVAGTHQCPHCPKRFKYRHSLAKHADTHLEKTHACPECSKMFGSVHLVKLHMKTHERMARGTLYHCSYCGKGFYETYNLKVHERTHRNDKPFKCDICESSFITNSSLKRHVKVSHSGAKPYTCQVCQKCFSTESIRDRHALRVHSDQKQFPHQCQLCPRRYMKPKDLRNHTYKMHSKKKISVIKGESF